MINITSRNMNLLEQLLGRDFQVVLNNDSTKMLIKDFSSDTIQAVELNEQQAQRLVDAFQAAREQLLETFDSVVAEIR